MLFEIIADDERFWQWRLMSESATIVAISPRSYHSRAECLYAVALAMAASNAGIRELGPGTGGPLHTAASSKPI